ncbi:transglutaminase-like domain-containing protein [Phycicoccus sp. MAQZ13P-2]|uniref:transglutaminase-like domain-containing protein n=1 Tax=Phycicoccus mangrovi TaxID=2840470 RepID=UPI001BFFE4B4|nr:transglutaminase-like domain-containing protein [Phycicoccus mangrovi]MBT9258039.1 transglutaminase-like domain-containing protein [Phycicoccus mangrovi]MBT9276023.1 transglutaminase-like domain-containing protein [Phycicoccus mangrovi]
MSTETARVPSRTGSRTIGRIAVTGRPTREDLVDAGFVVVLGLVALSSLRTSFDSLGFLAVGATGLLLGVAVAHVATVLRQPWVVLALLTVLAFFVAGGAVALRPRAIGGVLPGPQVLRELGTVSVTGWKDFLTTLPPVDGSGPFLVLPYALGLATGAAAFAWARRSSHAARPVLVPLTAVALGILLGTVAPGDLLVRGLAVGALAVVWIGLRQRRTVQVVGHGARHRQEAVVAVVLLAVALGVGAGAGRASQPGGERFVLRSLVAPPFDITRYPSPLVGFRTYTEGAQRAWDEPMLQVSGVPAGGRLRLAVLDDYSGTVWAATSPERGGGFRRVGTSIAPSGEDPTTAPATVTVRVEDYYAGDNGLNLWVPGTGSSTRVLFAGPRARALADGLRYDAGTGQSVVSTRLAAGDTVTSTERAVPLVPESGFRAGAGATVDTGLTAFVGPAAAKLAGKDAAAGSSWEALQAVGAALRSRGAYSDGSGAGQAQYLPGHGEGRLASFLGARQPVGNDEQYASTFALVANDLGIPARVVLGALVPEGGRVTGKDVHAWVEVRDASGRWYAVPRERFMPDRDKTPDENPPPPVAEENAAEVPPPNAVRPPGSLDALLSNEPTTVEPSDPGDGPLVPAWVLTVLRWVAVPVGGVVGLALLLAVVRGLRARRRRGTGPPSRRLAQGWTEVVDRARDLGVVVPKGLTRREQARITGFAALAARADAAVFGAGEPDDDEVARFWSAVRTARGDLTRRASLRRRVTRRLAVTSLLHRDPRPVETRPAASTVRPRRRPVRRLRHVRSAS